jgi:hypothetical protein
VILDSYGGLRSPSPGSSAPRWQRCRVGLLKNDGRYDSTRNTLAHRVSTWHHP